MCVQQSVGLFARNVNKLYKILHAIVEFSKKISGIDSFNEDTPFVGGPSVVFPDSLWVALKTAGLLVMS